MATELEATRSELSRGVMELPEETRASAAAMRRVVAEQIEALSELNAIVRSQPATHDLNDRPAAPPRAPSPPREERRPEPRPEPVREAPRAAEPLRVVEAARPAPKPAPVAEAPRPVVAEAPKAAAPKGEDGGGWLRDVLRNANTPASAPAQQNLTALTDEIARAMDPAALAEAWQRYQSGEQNVFTRRVYTLTSQSTYDEVRKRLQRDNDFAKNAAAYMAEFEQLLKRAAGGADPVGETRQYLLSDRGKVYTMLAHASGRLG